MAQHAAKAAKRMQTSDAASASESENSLIPAALSEASDEEEQEDAAAASPSSASSLAQDWSTALRRTIAIAARLRTELAAVRSLAAEEKAVRERAEMTAEGLATRVLALEKLLSSARPLPPDVSSLGMPSFLDTLGWCMLYTTKRGMPETDICVRLKALAQMAGWHDIQIPSLQRLKQIAPFLRAHVYKLETALEASDNTVALVCLGSRHPQHCFGCSRICCSSPLNVFPHRRPFCLILF